MNRLIKLFCLSLIICLCSNFSVCAAVQDTLVDDIKYIDIQTKIIKDINACEFDYDDEITKGLTPCKEKKS